MPSPPAVDKLHRDASNFDFRIVTLIMILVTRTDLLFEYLRGGEKKDHRNIPFALHDATKWPRLRLLFPPAMLAEMLYLFEDPETYKATLQLRRVFQTMINLEEYDLDICPNPNFVKAVVDFSGMVTAELNPAGVADDAGSEN